MSTISAGTTSGTALVSTGDTTGALVIQTNGTTTAVTIDTSQNVGVGTASPTNRLSVVTASGSDGFVSVKSPLTDTAGVVIDGGTTSNKGAILKFLKNAIVKWQMGTDSAIIGGTTDNFHLYGGGADAMLFSTNATERARIPSAGGFQAVTTISVGNATPSSSGAGITFPATQSASSDANTLDDYEEGNWTPTVAATTTNPTVSSYPTRVGRYVKIGKQVTIYCSIQNNSSGGSGNLKITGLPFQATSDDVTASGTSPKNGNFSWGASKTCLVFAVGASQSHIDVYAMENGVTEAGIPIGNFNADSKYLNITITYYV